MGLAEFPSSQRLQPSQRWSSSAPCLPAAPSPPSARLPLTGQPNRGDSVTAGEKYPCCRRGGFGVIFAVVLTAPCQTSEGLEKEQDLDMGL